MQESKNSTEPFGRPTSRISPHPNDSDSPTFWVDPPPRQRFELPTRYRALESEIIRLFPEFKPKPSNRRQRRSACPRVELI